MTDLVAAIEQAPDDDAAFRAYVDQLRTSGDPLVDAKPKVRLGALAAFGASIKVEKWRACFVDHVRLIADDEKHAQKMLDAFLAQPATRFVRTLELVMIGKRRSYADVDARLAHAGRPRTLTKLVLGKPGDHAFSPALLAAFPRIGALPRKSWDEIAKAIRALRGTGPAFANELANVASSAASEFGALPITSAELVRGLAAEIDRKQPIGLVARIVEDWSPTQLAELSAALITAWTLHGEEGAPWVWDVAARFGEGESARLIGRRFATMSHVRAEHAIDTLARMPTPLATLELFAASTHWMTRGELAEAALERRASNTASSSAPNAANPSASNAPNAANPSASNAPKAPNAPSARSNDDRAVSARTDDDRAVSARTNDDRAVSARTNDDRAVSRTAFDSANVLTLLARTGCDPRCHGEALARFRELDARAIEHLMVTGWAAPFASARACFAGERGTNLVWRTLPASGSTLFTLDGDRALSHDGSAVVIALDTPVSLVHVADPDLRALAAWKMWQHSHPVPFEQLARSAPPHASLDDLAQLARNTSTSIEALRARGYRNGGFKTDDTREELFYVKTHRYDGQSYSVTLAMVGDPIRASRALPSVVRFEVARDIAQSV